MGILDPKMVENKSKKRNRGDDMSRYKVEGIIADHHQKAFLEKNLTKIIQLHTAKIRQQAKQVTWD